MKSNSQIRSFVWKLLIVRQWFWKLFAVSTLLSLAAQFILGIVDGLMGAPDGATLDNLSANMMNYDGLSAFSSGTMADLLPYLLLMIFLRFIMAGIMDYGNNLILNRAVEGNEENWFSSAFGGFKIPLDLAWLMFRKFLVYLCWSLAATVAVMPILFVMSGFPGLGCNVGPYLSSVFSNMFNISVGDFHLCVSDLLLLLVTISVYVAMLAVPFYKYRFLFRIKADHPDWLASECMRYCRDLTNGSKMRIFKLDCSYWGILACLISATFALCAVMIFVARIGGEPSEVSGVQALLFFLPIALLLAITVLLVFANFYIGLGQTVLYKELAAQKEAL